MGLQVHWVFLQTGVAFTASILHKEAAEPYISVHLKNANIHCWKCKHAHTHMRAYTFQEILEYGRAGCAFRKGRRANEELVSKALTVSTSPRCSVAGLCPQWSSTQQGSLCRGHSEERAAHCSGPTHFGESKRFTKINLFQSW